MKKILTNLLGWAFFLISTSLFAQQQVDFTVKFNSTTSEYEVYAKPSQTGSFAVGGGSQISIVLPASAADSPLTITNVTGGIWSDQSQIYAPTAQPANDFHGIASDGSQSPAISFVAGVETLLYKFSLGGSCVAGVRIYRNAAEGAAPRDPNSSGAGMGGGDFENFFTTSSGPSSGNNLYQSNYANTGSSCTVSGSPDIITSIGQPTTPLTVGQVSNVPMTVTNQGTAPSTGPISSTMTLPAGTSAPASFTSGTSTCSTTGQTVTCSTPGPLSNTSPNSFVINVPVTPSASTAGTTPTFNGTATTPDEAPANATNNAASPMSPTTPVAGVPDLVTTIGQPTTPFTAGQPSNVPVTISNIGSAPANGPITSTITLPTGTSAPASFTSGTSSCSTIGQTVTCSTPGPLTNVAPNNTVVINVPVTPSASTVGTSPTPFTATTSSPNEPAGNTTNNPATPMTPTTPVVGTPDLTTTIGQPTTPLAVGQVSNIPVTITNIGTAPATGPITTTINLPSGTSAPASFTSGTSTCSTTGQTVSCTTPGPLSNVSPNNTVSINVPVTPSASTAGTTPTFTGTTSAPNEPAGNTGNNPATPMIPTTPVGGLPDLVTTIGQPATPLTVGQASNIPITVSNIGTAPSSSPVTTTMTLPTGTTAPASFTSGISTCGTSGQTVTCITPTALSNIAPNNTVSINVPVTPLASSVGTTPTFAATTSAANEPVGNTSNNPATPMTPTTPVAGVPDLVTTIGQPMTPFVAGQPSNVPITTTNIGSGPATSPITTIMTLPSGTSAPASFTSGSSTCNTSGQTVTCNTPGPLSNISPNNAITINVPVTPSASIVGTSPTFAGTSTAPNEPVANAGNNTATPMTPATPVSGVPDLVSSIGQPSPALTVGQASNIPVTITNQGSAPATGALTFTATLPNTLTTPASFSGGNGWSCNTSGQTVTCTNPNATGLPATVGSNTTMFNIPVTPISGSAGQSPTITGTVSPVPNETNTGNNVSTPMTTTSPIQSGAAPDLALTYGSPNPALMVGTLSSIPVTVTNVGNATATGQLVFTFNIPNNTTSPSSYNAGNGWVCSASGSVLTCVNPNASGIAPSIASTFNIQLTPMANSAGQTVILNGTVTPVPTEAIVINNTNVTVLSPAIAPGSTAITLTLKAFLQGAAVNGTSGLMRDDLRTKNLIPNAQPYTATAGYTHVAGGGTETLVAGVLTTTGNNAIVDWVMVELRSSANPATVVATRSALIQRDGDIVDVNGTSALSFGTLAAGNYYISVRHRNHVSVMTANTVAVSSSTPMVDFTSTSLANYMYPVGNLKRNIYPQVTDVSSGKNMLWAGNAYRDDKVIFQGPDNDVDAIFFSVMTDLTNTSQFTNFIKNNVYDQSDIDMDGRVIFQGPNNEVDLIFFEVLTHLSNTSQFLNYIIWQQLP